MKRIFFTCIALLFACLATTTQGCNNASSENKNEQKQEKAQYICPMDCEKGITHDAPGQCPVCGMDLEKAPTNS